MPDILGGPGEPPELDGLPLERRLLLAIMRLSSHDGALSTPDRQVLDVLGQTLAAGPDRLRTIDAINRLNTTVLARTHRKLDFDGGSAPTLEPDERLVIDALGRLADDSRGEDDLGLAGVMDQRTRASFRESALEVLGSPSLRDLPTPMSQARSALERPASERPAHRRPILECHELSLSETVILQLVRLLVRGIFTGFDGIAAVRLSCAHLALPRLGETVCMIVHRVASDARRRIDVRCLCCTEVSPDEARLLAGLAALGRGRPREYHEHLLEWLSADRARAVFALTCDAAVALAELGTDLPSREWDFGLLVARQPLFAAMADQDNRTLH